MLALLSVSACGGGAHDDRDLAEAVAAARSTDSLVLVQIADRSAPLREAMTATWNDPAVAAAAAGCTRVVLDADQAMANRATESTLGARCVLASALLDGSGRPVALRVGYAGVGEQVAWLRRAVAAAPELRRLRTRLAARPDDATARLLLGERLLELGCMRPATAHLERVAAAGGGRLAVIAGERLARVAVEAGEPQRARRWLLRAGPLPADSCAARVALTGVLVLYAERHADAARALLLASLTRWPDAAEHDRMLLELARDRAATGEAGAAAEVFAALLRAHPRSPWRFAARRGIEVLLVDGAGGHRHAASRLPATVSPPPSTLPSAVAPDPLQVRR